MKKSLIKYVLNKVKNDTKFESRMIDVFDNELSGEDALEVLALGYPTKVTVLDTQVLANHISRITGFEVLEVTNWALRKDCRLDVHYTCMKTRWFKNDEDADIAVANNDKYGGLSYNNSDYTIQREFEVNDSTWVNLCDIDDCIEVERD